MTKTQKYRVINNTVIKALQKAPSDHFDGCLCDPPYGLSKQPNMTEVLTHWIAGDDYESSGSGFMGKDWDSFVPGPATWRTIYRVMKPGSFLLVFSGTRTVDLMTIAIRLADFEIKDQMMHFWVYGSGFPKSHNIGNSIDKKLGKSNRGSAIASGNKHHPTTGKARRSGDDLKKYKGRTETGRIWDGYGTALKPAFEPIIVAMKPLDGTYAQNALAHGVAGLNIDDSRVGDSTSKQGRWPANVILRHHKDCKQIGIRSEKGRTINRFTDGAKPFGNGAGHPYESEQMDDETIPVYECHPVCPVRRLDEQGEVRKSGMMKAGQQRVVSAVGTYGDIGGASRFFKNIDPEGDDPFIYTSKAGKKERTAGVDTNTHPTLKPIRLTSYLANLILPPKRKSNKRRLLVPFSGSGSEMIGAMLAGWEKIIGIESDRDEGYVDIAKSRIDWWMGRVEETGSRDVDVILKDVTTPKTP